MATASGKYYAQVTVEDVKTHLRKQRRVPLVDADKNAIVALPEAVKALHRLRDQRDNGDLPLPGRKPMFSSYVTHYFETIEAGAGTKNPGTIANDKYLLGGWAGHLGDRRLDKIREVDIIDYRTKRLKDGVSPRTVNTDVLALRGLLKLAKREGIIKSLPEVEWLKVKTPKRDLFTVADLEALCDAALATNEDGTPVTKNGQQLTDFLRLLAYSGAREQEGIKLRWKDIDSDNEQLTIGAAGDTKNSSSRTVDFNPKLKAHLEDMKTRKAPDSKEEWLFPSPQRGEKDVHARTFRESLKLARAHAVKVQKKAGLKPTLAKRAFHDCRHHFISFAVMSGVDYMTIASWVGHRDGGVLIGKVYGHLADEHKKAMGAKLNFGPAVVQEEEGKAI
jgi:integrase